MRNSIESILFAMNQEIIDPILACTFLWRIVQFAVYSFHFHRIMPRLAICQQVIITKVPVIDFNETFIIKKHFRFIIIITP